MLYPVMMSGSQSRTKLAHFSSISPSLGTEMTVEPTMGAQVSSVNTFLMNGSFSPCLITMLAI